MSAPKTLPRVSNLAVLPEHRTDLMMRKFFLPFVMMVVFGLTALPTQKASADDFIDLDLAGVAPAVRNVFRNAERFWESRISGYSNTLPATFRAQLNGRLAISATTAVVDGPGGILGFAGPDTLATFSQNAGNRNRPLAIQQYALPLTSSMFFDVADAGRADFSDTVIHEMGHALGIGTLWTLNGIFDPADPTWRQGLLQQKRGDQFHFVGQHALKGFRTQSGHHRANYVPTDQPSLGHWSPDNWFFAPRNNSRIEMMTPFASANPFFTSEASWGSLADLGYGVSGFNRGSTNQQGSPGRPLFPKSNFSVSAVPEPTSAVVLVLGLGGILVRRRRTA